MITSLQQHNDKSQRLNGFLACFGMFDMFGTNRMACAVCEWIEQWRYVVPSLQVERWWSGHALSSGRVWILLAFRRKLLGVNAFLVQHAHGQGSCITQCVLLSEYEEPKYGFVSLPEHASAFSLLNALAFGLQKMTEFTC